MSRHPHPSLAFTYPLARYVIHVPVSLMGPITSSIYIIISVPDPFAFYPNIVWTGSAWPAINWSDRSFANNNSGGSAT